MTKLEQWRVINEPGSCRYQLAHQLTPPELEMITSGQASFKTLFQLNFPELHCWLLLNLDECDWVLGYRWKKHLSNSRIELCLTKDASQQFNEAWKDCIVEKV